MQDTLQFPQQVWAGRCNPSSLFESANSTEKRQGRVTIQNGGNPIKLEEGKGNGKIYMWLPLVNLGRGDIDTPPLFLGEQDNSDPATPDGGDGWVWVGIRGRRRQVQVRLSLHDDYHLVISPSVPQSAHLYNLYMCNIKAPLFHPIYPLIF